MIVQTLSFFVLELLGALADGGPEERSLRWLEGVDPNTLSCDPDGNEFLLLPHFEECNKFYMCMFGEEVEFYCTATMIFDFFLQRCNWESMTECILRDRTEDVEGSGNEIEGSGERGGTGEELKNEYIALKIPTFKLNNGAEIPAVGYGTWLGVGDSGEKKSTAESFSFEFDGTDIPRLVETLSFAIDQGYRHIDTAHVYRVEPEVGQVVNEKIKQGVIKREDVFITTKVWQNFHREGDVEVGLRGSLRRLDLDYVDLLLIHWPMSVSVEGIDEKIDFLDTWRGFESVLAKGLTKGIGVSNLNLEQMKRLLANCKVKPAVNQIEVNLNLGQAELVDYCKANGVQVVAYSPLGTMIPSRAALNTPEPKLTNPILVAIAKKYNKTVTQVTFRYLFQRGLVIIPKTVTKERTIENASIFDFHLDNEELETIAKFDVGFRTVRPVFYQDYTHYPFDKVEGVKMALPHSFKKWKNGAKANID